MRHSTGHSIRNRATHRRQKAVIGLASLGLLLVPSAPVIAEVASTEADLTVTITAPDVPEGSAWSVDLAVSDSAGNAVDAGFVGTGGDATEATFSGITSGAATLAPVAGALACDVPDADAAAGGYQVEVTASADLTCEIHGLAASALQTLAVPAAADAPVDPVTEPPVAEQPVTEEPVTEAPAAEAPAADPSGVEEPAADASADPTQDDAAEQPTAQDPVDDPGADALVTEGPLAQAPVTEDPAAPAAEPVVSAMEFVPMVADTSFFPTTKFELDGDRLAPNDWDQFYGPYVTSQGCQSAGIVSSTSGRDYCAPTQVDYTIISPGTKIDSTSWPRANGKPNEKGDLCSTAAAIEVVNVDGEYHYLYYSMWTRSPDGTGDLSVYSMLAGPLAGRSDDRLIEFDYNPSAGDAVVRVLSWNGSVWYETNALGSTDFAYALGRNTQAVDGGTATANHPTFGEYVVNLTTADVLPPDECNTFTATSSVSRTGNDQSANLQDYIDYTTGMSLRSCNAIQVTKEVTPLAPRAAPSPMSSAARAGAWSTTTRSIPT